jgi:hypothetical protein
MLEQPPRPATTSAKKLAFAKTDAICFKPMPYPASRLSTSREAQEVPGRGVY